MDHKDVVDNSNWLVRQRVVQVAERNLGYGETEGNNRGRFIRAIGGKDGQEWCATFAGYCYERAFEEVGLPMSFARSQGAKRLCKNLGAVGYIDRLEEPRSGVPLGVPLVGDLACWSRGTLGWTGHVGIVVEASGKGFCTIEGNVGGKVVWRQHRYGEPKFWRFAGLAS